MSPTFPIFIGSLVAYIVSAVAQTCGADGCGTSVVPFWRSFSSGALDHFYTISTPEFLNADSTFLYSPEGVAAGVFSSQQGVSVPLFRLNNVELQDHFYTTNNTERDEFIAAGYTLEGTAAWVYADGVCGSHPLFRLFNAETNDHFYTTSGPELQTALTEGYQSQGVAALVTAVGIANNEVTCLGPGAVGLSST
ncbi:glycoside hydrolase, family 25 [Mycena capillaripes]|nr:glycoside hydrolase, family 25 [Mycena capillaripes]